MKMNPPPCLPRVLQVLPSLGSSGGGVERGTIDVARFLGSQGPTFVASAGGGLVERLVANTISHFEVPLDTKNPLQLVLNARTLAALIRTHRIDIVHARSRAPAWSAYLAARQTGCHFITTFHGTYNFSNPLKKTYNAIMTWGERVIAPSQFIADHIAHHYHLSPQRIRVIHRGIDTHFFDPAHVLPQRVSALRTAWGLQENIPTLLCPGRLTRWKGQELLLEALTGLKDRPFQCIFLGGHQGRTAYHQNLETLIETRGLAAHTRIVPPVADMPAAYLLADVVVAPSLDPEAFGRVAAEAGAMGCPVIASRHGGALEIIQEGKTGWLFTPGDREDLREAIHTWLQTSRPPHFSEVARAHILAHFNLDTMCRQTLAVYQEVMA